MSIARFSNRAQPPSIRTGIFFWYEAKESHEMTRMAEPVKVAEFGD